MSMKHAHQQTPFAVSDHNTYEAIAGQPSVFVADSLIERYQAGKRAFNGWNLSEEDLSRAKGVQCAQLAKAMNLEDATLPERTFEELEAFVKQGGRLASTLTDAPKTGLTKIRSEPTKIEIEVKWEAPDWD